MSARNQNPNIHFYRLLDSKRRPPANGWPQDSYAAVLYSAELDTLDVAFDTPDKVFNALAWLAAHEMGHTFGLQHISRGAHHALPDHGIGYAQSPEPQTIPTMP